MSKFTQGTWRAYYEENKYIWSSDDEVLGELYFTTPEETKANARLIAAAPEMYELLKEIKEQSGIQCDMDCDKTGKVISRNYRIYLNLDLYNKIQPLLERIDEEEVFNGESRDRSRSYQGLEQESGMSKFTKGTWKYAPVAGNVIEFTGNDEHIDEKIIALLNPSIEKNTRELIGRLIAAAPDIYELLREELIPSSDYGGIVSFERECKIKKVLAQIDGEDEND